MSFDESFLPKAVNEYLERQIAHPFPVMDRVERETHAEGLPALGRQSGALLRMLAASLDARRVLEVGTNVGYSGLWLCAGLAKDGVFEGIEIDPALARRAEASLREAVGPRARVHVAAALDVLPGLPAQQYDLVFLDAVKAEYPAYLDHALRLLRPGGIVAADNMFWIGAVWDEQRQDPDTRGVREYTRRVFSERGLASTIVPVEDGMAVSVLRTA